MQTHDVLGEFNQPRSGSLPTMRIIGIELKMRDQMGQQMELEMFSTGLIVPSYFHTACRPAFPITIHTNFGDINGQIG